MQKMILAKINICYAMVFLFVINSASLFAQAPHGLTYQFTQTDSSYTFRGSFQVKAKPECLLDISFQYPHIRILALDAKEVRLIDQGADWNRISYTYQRFLFFESTTIWHRTLNGEQQRVDFYLLSSENNRAQMPRIINSSGFYQLKRQGEYWVVEYFQQCLLSNNYLVRFYLNKAQKEAIRFITCFSEYASTLCKRPDSITLK